MSLRWVEVLLKAQTPLELRGKLAELTVPAEVLKLLKDIKRQGNRMEAASLEFHGEMRSGLADILSSQQVSLEVLASMGTAYHELDQGFRKLAGEMLASVGKVSSLMISLSERPYPTTFIIMPDISKLRNDRGGFSKLDAFPNEMLPDMDRWMDLLSLLQDNVTKLADKTLKGFTQRLKDVCGDTSLRLKLVCEHCKNPAEPGIRITRVSETMVKMLPMMKLGLTILKAANFGSCIARFFAPGLPSIPEDVMQKLRVMLSRVERSREGVSFLDDAANTAVGQAGEGGKGAVVTAQVGPAQREFKQFLDQHDSRREWGNLTRLIVDQQACLWVCKDCMNPNHFAKVVKQQKEEREGKTAAGKKKGGSVPAPAVAANGGPGGSSGDGGPGLGSMRQGSLRGSMRGSAKGFISVADMDVPVLLPKSGGLAPHTEVAEDGDEDDVAGDGSEEAEEQGEGEGEGWLDNLGTQGADGQASAEPAAEDRTTLPGATRTSAGAEAGAQARKGAARGRGRPGKGHGTARVTNNGPVGTLPMLQDVTHTVVAAGQAAASDAVRDTVSAMAASVVPVGSKGLFSKFKSWFGGG